MNNQQQLRWFVGWLVTWLGLTLFPRRQKLLLRVMMKLMNRNVKEYAVLYDKQPLGT